MENPWKKTIFSQPWHGPVAEHRGDDVVGQAWILPPQAGNSWEISWDFMGTQWPKYGSKYRSLYIYISPPVLWSQLCANPQLKHGFLGVFGLYNNPQLGFIIISGFTS